MKNILYLPFQSAYSLFGFYCICSTFLGEISKISQCGTNKTYMFYIKFLSEKNDRISWVFWTKLHCAKSLYNPFPLFICGIPSFSIWAQFQNQKFSYNCDSLVLQHLSVGSVFCWWENSFPCDYCHSEVLFGWTWMCLVVVLCSA